MQKGRLPNLIVIGAAKSATTSLHQYLSLHPDVHMSKKKELRFFVPSSQYGNFERGIEWYKNNFVTDRKIAGETSPQYTLYPIISGVPARIHDTVGIPKIIYILRDPIDRLLSDYVQIVDEYCDTPDFYTWLNTINERESYFYSQYFTQLGEYIKLFDISNILIIISERFIKHKRQEMKKVFSFIDVESEFWCDEFDTVYNARKSARYISPWFEKYAPKILYEQLREPILRSRFWKLYSLIHWLSRIGGQEVEKPTLTQSEDEMLQSLFRDDVQRLRSFLSDEIPEWRAYR